MTPVKLILCSLVMVLTGTDICYSAASLHLRWNGNTETDLAGYKIYYGTSSGSYGSPRVLGDITEYELTGLEEGVRYYIAMSAYDTSNNESDKSDEESGVTPDTSNVGNEAVFGYTTLTGNRRALPFTMPEEGTIQSVTIYHNGGSGNMLLGVYDGESLPDSLLGVTPQTAVSGSAGWQEVNLITPVSVPSGTTIWLAWIFENSPGIRYQGGTPGRAHSAQSWSSGRPDPFGSSSQANYIYSIYATYAASGPDWDPPTPLTTTTTAVTTTIPATTTTTLPATGIALYNGIDDSGTVDPLEEDLYYIDIPDGQGHLLVELTGNPDADLYLRYGSPPTLAQWDCRPYSADSSNEMCSSSDPDSGIWYIMVRGYADTVDYDIVATYDTGSPPVTTTTSAPPPPPTTTTTTPGTTTIPSTTTTTAPGTTTTPSTTTTTASGTTTTPSTTSTISVTTTIIASDSTPPTGTVTINNNSAITHSFNVILTLAARDNGQELGKNAFMSFSNDALQWSDPEPYTTAKFWTLSPDEGTKTVYAQFRDAAGNWMTAPAQDHIIYEESEDSCEEPQKLRPVATTASSQILPLYAKDNAVDGNPSTIWSTLLSFFKKDEFITLDMGETKRISWFTMQAASTLFGTDFFPVNFTIEISTDNMTWKKISTEQGYAPPIQSTHSDSWDFTSLECRYIRVYITKTKNVLFFFKMARIAEIEVYGCNTTVNTPLLAQETASLVAEEDATTEERTPEESGEQKGFEHMLPTIPGKPTITLSK